MSSQWGSGGGGAPAQGIPSPSLIPAQPLLLLLLPLPRAWNWVWGGFRFQSHLLQQQARALHHSGPLFSEAPAVLCTGLLPCGWQPEAGITGGALHRGAALEDQDSCR